MEKKLIRDMNRKVLGGVVAGLQRSYAPQMDLSLLRVLVAVGGVLIPPLTPVVIVAYGVLWIVAPRSDRMALPPLA
ncbi:PspC domain-containing protein [Deinococcus radiopugnans]|uniref:Phage shock protein PspC (Stress-responsive transcriptional regulator) n=1 Tax=Deinococcus radiopugnans ATCC 19172 TaxID=585398 RepID=A0A5C4Y661_9DEIO|nr:PspC domain-containing protein [Deinococcus radiopugnans]MBB6016322.1 phage shock protein PspC (stress-responsive transcriptional regulator) [Deinococcus radiopugnans ATCC 19172]QLG12237.1 PspC domain-containing protein [Deinococcus sp. D7000]TNM71290.1 PspC domain-containing protein [Deinococcus radiopugnans ATCC 19172]